MSELIKLIEKDGKKLVNARDLHQFLVVEAKGGQTGEMFAHWIKRNLDYLRSVEGVNYSTIEYDYLGNELANSSKSNSQKVSKRDYALTIETAKEISMIQNNDKGQEARTYFIECERQLKEQTPRSFAQALRLAAEQQERIEAQEAQMKALAPKVDYYENVLQSESLITPTVIAKDLGMSAMKLNMVLNTLGIAYKEKNESTWVLYSKYQDKGYTKTKTHTYESDGVKLTRHHTYWTEAGREFVMKKVREFMNVEVKGGAE